jgi:uncharacterized protein (TIGR04255 family)
MGMFRFDDLTLEQVIFEVRFPKGFLYWDRCGSIWRSISDKWPKLTMREVNTERARFSLRDNDIEMSFSHNRISIHQDYPKRLNTFKVFTKDSFEILLDAIEVNSFSRVGNRYKYIFDIEDHEQIIEFFEENQLVAMPEKAKHIGKSIREPSVRFIIEREDISMTVSVAYFKRNLELSIPKPLEVDTKKFIAQGISIDLDFFSTKIVDRGTFDAEDFINAHEKSSRRVIEQIFS